MVESCRLFEGERPQVAFSRRNQCRRSFRDIFVVLGLYVCDKDLFV